MVDYVLGLVTLFHPDRFLCCSSAELHNHPHALRYRSERTQRVAGAGFPFAMQYLDDHAVLANGREVSACRDTLLAGGVLAEHLADPRLIYIPDETRGRPKWRAEFRRQWSEVDPALTATGESMLRNTIARSHLRIRGVWVNPSIDSRRPNTEWVNLVVGPCASEAAVRFLPANLTLKRDELGNVIISLPGAHPQEGQLPDHAKT